MHFVRSRPEASQDDAQQPARQTQSAALEPAREAYGSRFSRFLVRFLGVIVAMVMFVISSAMNFRFGMTLGTTPLDSYFYAFASLTADGFKALLPFIVIGLWHGRKRTMALGAVGVWVLCVAWSMASAIGFASMTRDVTTAKRAATNDERQALRERADRLAKNIALLPAHRPAAVVSAAIENADIPPRIWRRTRKCTDVTRPDSRAACEPVLVLRQELATAQQAAKLEADLKQTRALLGKQKVIGERTDPQAETIASILNWAGAGKKPADASAADVRIILAVMITILIEAGSSLGFTVVALGSRDMPKRYVPNRHAAARERAERRLNRRIEKLKFKIREQELKQEVRRLRQQAAGRTATPEDGVRETAVHSAQTDGSGRALSSGASDAGQILDATSHRAADASRQLPAPVSVISMSIASPPARGPDVRYQVSSETLASAARRDLEAFGTTGYMNGQVHIGAAFSTGDGAIRPPVVFASGPSNAEGSKQSFTPEPFAGADEPKSLGSRTTAVPALLRRARGVLRRGDALPAQVPQRHVVMDPGRSIGHSALLGIAARARTALEIARTRLGANASDTEEGGRLIASQGHNIGPDDVVVLQAKQSQDDEPESDLPSHDRNRDEVMNAQHSASETSKTTTAPQTTDAARNASEADDASPQEEPQDTKPDDASSGSQDHVSAGAVAGLTERTAPPLRTVPPTDAANANKATTQKAPARPRVNLDISANRSAGVRGL